MPKIEYDKFDIQLFEMTEEGKAYLEYNDKIGGEPIAPVVPYGYPEGFELYPSAIELYKDCIARGITWEELLNYNPPEDVII